MSIHGLLLIDKPKGITSHDAVGRLRRLLKQRAVGHAGTLDPLASGLMVMLLGDATKLSNYLLNSDKAYQVTVEFGVHSDTLDRDGEVEVIDPHFLLDEAQIDEIWPKMMGELELPVPIYSAVKRKGKKLYEYAREQKEVEIPQRLMTFYEGSWEKMSSNTLRATLSCSKGSYIRAWAAHLGELMGTKAIVAQLRRSFSSPYGVERSVGLDDLGTWLERGGNLKDLGAFVPLSSCLSHWPAVTVAGRDERLMFNGQVPKQLERRLIWEQKQANQRQKPLGIKVMGADSQNLISLLEAVPNEGLRIKRVFHGVKS